MTADLRTPLSRSGFRSREERIQAGSRRSDQARQGPSALRRGARALPERLCRLSRARLCHADRASRAKKPRTKTAQESHAQKPLMKSLMKATHKRHSQKPLSEATRATKKNNEAGAVLSARHFDTGRQPTALFTVCSISRATCGSTCSGRSWPIPSMMCSAAPGICRAEARPPAGRTSGSALP